MFYPLRTMGGPETTKEQRLTTINREFCKKGFWLRERPGSLTARKTFSELSRMPASQVTEQSEIIAPHRSIRWSSVSILETGLFIRSPLWKMSNDVFVVREED
jgi:hypothetical protein